MKSTTKKPKVHRVERTRNGGTETESMHMGKIRAALRNISRWWKPLQYALKAASKTTFVGRRKQVVYLCSSCCNYYSRKSVEVNHIVPAGSLKTYDDLPDFCRRLFTEDVSQLEVLCKDCHLEVTKQQKEKSFGM